MLLVALLLAAQPNVDQATLRKMAGRFAPTEVTADLRALPDGERAALAKEEVEKWQKSLSGAERDAATGFFTVIRRGPGGAFTIVPYSIEYQPELGEAARFLREAARLTQQPTLKRFLETRAEAFFTNDYYQSDVAWMELDASIEATIGPCALAQTGTRSTRQSKRAERSTASRTRARYSARGISTQPSSARCGVRTCTSKSWKPRSRSRCAVAAKATFEAPVARWNIDSPANNVPMAMP